MKSCWSTQMSEQQLYIFPQSDLYLHINVCLWLCVCHCLTTRHHASLQLLKSVALSNMNDIYLNKRMELWHYTSKTNTAAVCVCVRYSGNTPKWWHNNMLAPNHARAKSLSDQIQERMMKSMGVWENIRLPLQSHRQIHLSLSPPPSMTRHTVQYDQWCMLSLCAWQHLFHTSLTCIIQYYRAPITSLLQCVILHSTNLWQKVSGLSLCLTYWLNQRTSDCD